MIDQSLLYRFDEELSHWKVLECDRTSKRSRSTDNFGLIGGEIKQSYCLDNSKNHMGKLILLVDYENVQNIDLSSIQEQNLQIKIFVGQSQSKLPLELVQSTQKLGNAVEWIKIEGSGNNSLDFHIAFYLGQLSQEDPKLSFAILSKDKGYDPLIRYLGKRKVFCQRIESLKSLFGTGKNLQQAALMEEIIIKLSKLEKQCRPKSRNALTQHIKSLLKSKEVSQQELDLLINNLFLQKKVLEADNCITYNF